MDIAGDLLAPGLLPLSVITAVINVFDLKSLRFDQDGDRNIKLIVFALIMGLVSLLGLLCGLWYWYTVSMNIPEYDPLYHHVLDLCAEMSREEQPRSVIARSHFDVINFLIMDEDRSLLEASIAAPPDFLPEYKTWWKVTDTMFLKRNKADSDGYYGSLRICSLGTSYHPVIEFLKKARQQYRKPGRIMIKYPRDYESIKQNDALYAWTGKPVPCRAKSMDQICLRESAKEELLGDIDTFLASKTKTEYIRTGNPYRRGYLLWGCPGTGKTALAKALALRTGFRMHLINIMDLGVSDACLQKLIISVTVPAIILIEDIDPANLLHADQRDSSRENSRRSFAGILNALDGPLTPEGIILIITTNSPPESFPEALLRPGRIDFRLEFKHATPSEAVQLFKLHHSTHENLASHAEEFERTVVENDSFQRSHAAIKGFLSSRSPEEACLKWPDWVRKVKEELVDVGDVEDKAKGEKSTTEEVKGSAETIGQHD